MENFLKTPSKHTLEMEKFLFFLYLPNFILRCLKRSANASSSRGSVSWSGWRLAAATAAAMAEWWEPEKWQFVKSLRFVRISFKSRVRVRDFIGQSDRTRCVSAQRPAVVMVTHHVVHTVVGPMKLVVWRGDWRLGHWRERRHRAGRVAHQVEVLHSVHLKHWRHIFRLNKVVLH